MTPHSFVHAFGENKLLRSASHGKKENGMIFSVSSPVFYVGISVPVLFKVLVFLKDADEQAASNAA